MKTIRTAKESRLTYTANGIKGKNGEIISSWGELSYLPAYYDFDPVRLEIRLTVKDYKQLRIIPQGCNVRNDSDGMTDYYDNDRLTIPVTAGAEFLAAAIGYKKNIEVKRKKGEKYDYYRREAEQADRYADALRLAEQIASEEIDNGAEIIAERIQSDKEQNTMKYTLEQLRERNRAYAEQITPALLEHVNRLVTAVEQTRTNKPQPLDNVDFTNKYGERTEHATIDGQSVTNIYDTTICEHATPEPVIKDDGTVTAYIGCGGAFYGYNADKMKYKGTTAKTCKIYGGDYLSGYFPIYFDCTVSSFEYDARSRKQYAEQMREKATD